MNKKTFDKIIKRNYEEVCNWEQWKKKKIISSESANTGKFVGKDIKD